MSETPDNRDNITQISEISNDFETVSETRFDTPTPHNGNIIHTSVSKLSLASSSVNCDSEYGENCSYMMIHSPTTDQRFSFTRRTLKCCLVASFLFILCTVILLFQAPVVLYYTTISPYIDDSDVTDYVDFKTCSVQVSDSYWCNFSIDKINTLFACRV